MGPQMGLQLLEVGAARIQGAEAAQSQLDTRDAEVGKQLGQ